MAKDPAFLFYYQDFVFGTTFMTNEQVGVYIKTLCYIADKGSITDVHISKLAGNMEIAEGVMEKLECIAEGVYTSPRLQKEVEKRKKFTESRRKNLKSTPHMEAHMEDENININRIKDRELIFKSEVSKFNYPTDTLKEFIEYWTEPNKSGSRMRFELEKTWDMKRRLARWSSNNFNKGSTKDKPTGKPMTQAQVKAYYKEHGKYPNQ